MKICISADHGGFELKNLLIQHIKDLGFEVRYNHCTVMNFKLYQKIQNSKIIINFNPETNVGMCTFEIILLK